PDQPVGMVNRHGSFLGGNSDPSRVSSQCKSTATILTATYAVVLFSIIVQGSTLGLVARNTLLGRKGEDPG
ncbi:hypothetical protein, partial [Roseomonas mucosa]